MIKEINLHPKKMHRPHRSPVRGAARCARAVGVDDLRRLVYGLLHSYLLNLAIFFNTKSLENDVFDTPT